MGDRLDPTTTPAAPNEPANTPDLPELYHPQLWDATRGNREQWRFHSIWEVTLRHPVIAARKAELHLWLDQPEDAHRALAGHYHPLCTALTARIESHQAKITQDPKQHQIVHDLARHVDEYNRSADPLHREAAMHLLDALANSFYHQADNPNTRHAHLIRALEAAVSARSIAVSLRMTDKARSLQDGIDHIRMSAGIGPSSSPGGSFDTIRSAQHAFKQLRAALLASDYAKALKHAREDEGRGTAMLVLAIRHYERGEYLRAEDASREIPTGRPEYRALWGALRLQVIARLGESVPNDLSTAVVEIHSSLSQLYASWETVGDIRALFPLGAAMANYGPSLMRHFDNDTLHNIAILRNETTKDGIRWDGRGLLEHRRGNAETWSGAPQAVRNLIFAGEAEHYLGEGGAPQEVVLAGDYGDVSATNKSRWRAYLRHQQRRRGLGAWTNSAAILAGLQRIAAIPRSGLAYAPERFRRRYRDVRDFPE